MEKTYDSNGKPMPGGKFDSYGFPIAANRAAAQLDANAKAKKEEGRIKLPPSLMDKAPMKQKKKKKSGLSTSEGILSKYDKGGMKTKKSGSNFLDGINAILNSNKKY